MKIDRVSITNFRGISETNIQVNGNNMILFGINGSGKSTILKSINVLFSRIINSITNNRYRQETNIEDIDITNGKKSATIKADICFGHNKFSCGSTRVRGSKGRAYSPTKDIKQAFCEQYLSPESMDMPVYINYGVHRLVIDVPLRIYKKHKFDKLSAFEKAIGSKIDFRTFFEWFRNQEDIENAMKVTYQNFDYTDNSLFAVKKAILSIMDGVTDIRVRRRPLSMEVKRDGRFYRIEQLSDGEKCTLALIGDIARRLALANPGSNNSNYGSGIVLIDEIELHMHPIWQRRILRILNKTFPNIQFIVTTHSPQVLGEAGEEYKIYSVSMQNNQFEINQYGALNAWSSNEILEELMGTDEVSVNAKASFSRMFQLIDEGLYNDAEKIAKTLGKMSYPNNPDIINAHMLIQKGRRGL